jgi:hexosaminidase
MVDAMAMVKLNVLHWHLVDSQAFPFNSSAAPNLSKGAWNWRETYSPDDLQGLVQYAKERGVRIMVEIDTPGPSPSSTATRNKFTLYPHSSHDTPNLFPNVQATAHRGALATLRLYRTAPT